MLVLRSLKSRLVALLVLTALPGIAIIFMQANTEHSHALTDARQRALEVTRQLTFSQLEIIRQTRVYLENLTLAPPLQNPESQQCSDFLESVLKLNDLFVNIGVPMPNGKLLCNALPLSQAVNVFDRSYFQESLNSKGFAIGEFQVDRAAQKTSVNFSYPVLSPVTKQVVGVAVAVVSLDWWSEQLENFRLPPKALAIISDVNGSVVANFPQDKETLGLPREHFGFSGLPDVSNNMQNEAVLGKDGVTRIFTHAVLYQDDDNKAVIVSVGIPFDNAIKTANLEFIKAISVFLFIILLVTLLAIKVLRKSILDPLTTLTQATESLEEGILSTQAINPNATDELAILQNRFQRMSQIRLDAEMSARSRNEELNSVFKALPDQYFRLDSKGTILDSKGTISDKMIVDQEYVLSQSATQKLSVHVSDIFSLMINQYLASDGKAQDNNTQLVEYQEGVFEARLSAIEKSEQFIIVLRDITERKRADDIIWRQAHYDLLTGLPNRYLLHDRIDHIITKAKHTKLSLAILFIDLDGFKDVNDTVGHEQGDKLLQEAAIRLKNCVHESDTVARLGGDEFTVVLEAFRSLDILEAIVERILMSMQQPFQLESNLSYVTASIGIALYPDDANDFNALLTAADQAMYSAKEQGRNRFQYFMHSMQDSAIERMHLVKDLRVAIEQNQFELFYQPVVSLDTGLIVKAEALIRWHHPIRGLVNPGDFILVAEETGMIVDIGNWVFREAAAAIQKLRSTFDENFQMSINTSPVQYSSCNSGIESWLEYLHDLGIPGSAIVAEITEGLMMDANDTVAQKLRAFAKGGMQVAVDDFGTGYSSLSYISEYDIDYLKIDRSFIKNLAPDSDALSLCEAIIVMAHKLGIKVIAEGIETEQQRAILHAADCDFGQGYLFAKPLPWSEFNALLRTQAPI